MEARIMKVTVYSKEHCPQCDATKRKLDKLGVAYDDVDLTDDDDLRSEMVSRGFKATPIVITDDDSWSGYRPDKIEELSNRAHR